MKMPGRLKTTCTKVNLGGDKVKILPPFEVKTTKASALSEWPAAAEDDRLSAAPVLVEDLHIIGIFFATMLRRIEDWGFCICGEVVAYQANKLPLLE